MHNQPHTSAEDSIQPVFENASNPWLLLYVPLAGGLPAVSSLGPLIGAGLAALAASWFFLRGMIGQAWRKLRGLQILQVPFRERPTFRLRDYGITELCSYN